MKQQSHHHQLEVVLRFKSWRGLVLSEATFYKVGEPSCHVQIIEYWPNGSIGRKVNCSLQLGVHRPRVGDSTEEQVRQAESTLEQADAAWIDLAEKVDLTRLTTLL